MALQSEIGFVYVLNDTQSGYSGGATFSHSMFLLTGPRPNLAVHVGLSGFQANRNAPLGAYVGVSKNGNNVIANPEDWLQSIYQASPELTISAIAYHGLMKAWSVVQFWD